MIIQRPLYFFLIILRFALKMIFWRKLAGTLKRTTVCNMTRNSAQWRIQDLPYRRCQPIIIFGLFLQKLQGKNRPIGDTSLTPLPLGSANGKYCLLVKCTENFKVHLKFFSLNPIGSFVYSKKYNPKAKDPKNIFSFT